MTHGIPCTSHCDRLRCYVHRCYLRFRAALRRINQLQAQYAELERQFAQLIRGRGKEESGIDATHAGQQGDALCRYTGKG